MSASAKLLKEFLLGNLSGEARDRLESEYFSDIDRFEQLELAENELIDSYVQGELSEEEQRRFRLQYLTSPGRRTKVDFARSLNEVAHKTFCPSLGKNEPAWWRRWFVPQGAMPWPQLALASAVAIVFTSGVLLLIQNRGLRHELQTQETANANLRESQEALASQLAQLRSPLSKSVIGHQPEEQAMVEQPLLPGASLTLVPGAYRGGKATEPTLVLPIRAASVRLKLLIDESEQDFRSFEAELKLVGTQEAPLKVASHAVAKETGGNTVILSIPSNSFRKGDYSVSLYAIGPDSTRNEVESYAFRVIGKTSRAPERP